VIDMSVEKATVPTLTRSDIRYLERRIERLNRKIRFLIATLIDKKVIGEDFGKTLVSETEESELIKWFKEVRGVK